MKRFSTILILFCILCIFSISNYAQSACDRLYSMGVKFQQTMTVSSQKNAISYFEKAKVCYDSQAKKELCDKQIKTCRNIILQITRSNKQRAAFSKDESSGNDETTVKRDSVSNIIKKRNISLSLDCSYIKFKGNIEDYKKVKVNCNSKDWKISDAPSWVTCSRNDNDEIFIEISKNPLKQERSGVLKVVCGDKSATLVIIQEKFKILGVL